MQRGGERHLEQPAASDSWGITSSGTDFLPCRVSAFSRFQARLRDTGTESRYDRDSDRRPLSVCAMVLNVGPGRKRGVCEEDAPEPGVAKCRRDARPAPAFNKISEEKESRNEILFSTIALTAAFGSTRGFRVIGPDGGAGPILHP
jgi:hypothetical protein